MKGVGFLMTRKDKRLSMARMLCGFAILAAAWLCAASREALAQAVTQDPGITADSAGSPRDDSGSVTPVAAKPVPAPSANAELLKELEAMRARIEELEAKLKTQSGEAAGVANSNSPALTSVSLHAPTGGTAPAPMQDAQTQAAPAKNEPAVPF